MTTGDNVIPAQVGARGVGDAGHDQPHVGLQEGRPRLEVARATSLFKLVDIVSKGGNYLLNVGPMADGVIPQPSQDILRVVGRWLKVNGEAVYGAGPTPFGDELGEPSGKGTKDLRGNPLFLPRHEWRVTTKPGKLYFTFFEEARAVFELPAMKNAVKRAYRLADREPVEMKVEGGRTSLQIGRPMIDPMATVVVVEIEGQEVAK